MCGVVGLVPAKPDKNLENELIHSLGLLLYRGYDSVGIARTKNLKIETTKIKAEGAEPHLDLLQKLDLSGAPASLALGHSRWATHGPANDINAHPHSDCRDLIVLVHNGIIENVQEIKNFLATHASCQGPEHYKSETDTEVVAHLIGYFKKKLDRKKSPRNFVQALRESIKMLRGSYALLVIDQDSPNTLLAVRRGSPLLLGVRNNAEDKKLQDLAVVSSAEPLANHGYTLTRPLKDGELLEIKPGSYQSSVKFYSVQGPLTRPKLDLLDVKASLSDKGDNDSFFEKEIKEQPEVTRTVISSHYVDEDWTARLGGFDNWNQAELKKIERVWLIAEGSSLHAAEVGAEWLRKYARLDATTRLASEFSPNPGAFDPAKTLFIVISQSGETADVRIAAEEIVRQGGKLFGLVNVVGSSIARLVGDNGGGMYTHAGPEISVASTKVYTAQLSQLAVLTLYLARNVRGVMSRELAQNWIKAHRQLPQLLEKTLQLWKKTEQLAEQITKADKGILYIGRGPNLATAREGALKLRELSYLNAVAYSAGEMKHGTIALVDKSFPTVAIAVRDSYREKMLGNIHEIKARQGPVIAVGTQGDDELVSLADQVLEIPPTHAAFTPILTTIPLQMLTYHVAKLRGCQIDMPRNLAKSVTVT